MSEPKDIPMKLQDTDQDKFGSNSRSSVNGTDALKRGREGEEEEDHTTMVNKRPDRNPFAKVDDSFSFDEEADLRPQTKKLAKASSLHAGSNDSAGSVDEKDDSEGLDSPISVRRMGSTPAALLRRMSLDNKRLRLRTSPTCHASSSADELPPADEAISEAVKTEGSKVDTGSDETPSAPSLPSSDAVQVEPPSSLPVNPPHTELASTISETLPSASIFGQNLSSKVANASTAGPTSGGFSGFGALAHSASPFSMATGFGSSFGTKSDLDASRIAPTGYLFAQALQQVQSQTISSSNTAIFPNTNDFSSDTGVSCSDSSSKSSELKTTEMKEKSADEEKDYRELLTESARREYDTKQQKPHLEQVDVITGEEAEHNVFELNVKLHAFDKESQQWKERGRAVARLNDAVDKSYSRLVLRMAGTLRIIVNVKIWKDMVVTKLSEKNISFSAFDSADDNLPKVFLITCPSHDAQLFFLEVLYRIDSCKMEESAKTSGDSTESDRYPEKVAVDSPTKKLRSKE